MFLFLFGVVVDVVVDDDFGVAVIVMTDTTNPVTHLFTTGCPSPVTTHPPSNSTIRHGTRCPAAPNPTASSTSTTNSADEVASSEKFVSGVTVAVTASCRRLKSSMLFWRSRMLRKKSRDTSGTGRMVVGGFSGGDWDWYWD